MSPAPDATLPARSRIDVSSIGRFQIDAELGRGGMAVVYAARDRETGERVALKVLNSVEATAHERFQREVKAASQLVHPGIARVIAFGDDAGKPFLAMELVEGGTLVQLTKKAPVVPGVVAAEILRQLLEALACAHAAGVIHRDLKPPNVMVTPGGAVKLLDFGIAKSLDDETITATGILVGTPAYMSPEQARCEPLDGRSDLFSAAMTVAAVVGKSAHRFSKNGRIDPTQMLIRVAFEPFGPLFERAPHVPVGLDLVLASLTAIVPDNRAPSASAALVALKDAGVLPKEGPALLADFIRDPAGVGARLCAEQRDREVAFAERVARRAGGAAAAALALHRAWHLVPDDVLAEKSRALCRDNKFTFDEVRDARVDDLMRSFEENPTHPGVLKALADRHKALGALRPAASFLWRYCVERPDDSHAALQLSVMLDGPGELDTEDGRRLSTKSIVAGIKTGGMKKSAASAGIPTRAMQRPSDGPPPRVVRSTNPGAPADAVDRTVALPSSAAARPASSARPAFSARPGSSARPAPSPSFDGENPFASAPSTMKRVAFAAVITVPIAVTLYLVVSSVALAKTTMKESAQELAEPAVPMTQVNQQLARVAHSQDASPADAEGAADMVLMNHPSIEAGREALWVRAKARAALGKNEEALKDCELYLEKTTEFDDPHIGDVKKLMGTLRNAPTTPPQEMLR